MNECWCLVGVCRIIGAVLIIVGLYLVLWGKSEEKKFAIQEKALIQSTTQDHGTPRIITSSHGKASLNQPLLQSSENVWSNPNYYFFLTRTRSRTWRHLYLSLCVYSIQFCVNFLESEKKVFVLMVMVMMMCYNYPIWF